MKNFLNLIDTVQRRFLSEEDNVAPEDTPAPEEDTPDPEEDVPGDDSAQVEADIYTLELIRKALLINRDEIDDDEYMYIQEPVTADNAAQIDEIITSIISKTGDNIGSVKPIGTYNL